MSLAVKTIDHVNEIEGFLAGYCASCGHPLDVGQTVCLEEIKDGNQVVYCDGCHESKQNDTIMSKVVRVPAAYDEEENINYLASIYLNANVKPLFRDGDYAYLEVTAPEYAFKNVKADDIHVMQP